MKLAKVLRSALLLVSLLALGGCPEMIKQPGAGGADRHVGSGGGD